MFIFIKSIKILDLKYKIRFYLLILLSILRALVEVVSIAFIIPILYLVTDEKKTNQFIENKIFQNIQEIFKSNLNVEGYFLIFILVFIFIYLLKTLFILFFNKVYASYLAKLYLNISNRILTTYLNKEYIFFVNTNTATLLRNISTESNVFAYGIIGSFLTFSSNLMLVLSICLFLIIYNFNLLYLIIFLFFFCYLVARVSNLKFRFWGKVRQEEGAKFIKKLNELFTSIKEILVYGKKELFINEVYKSLSNFSKSIIFKDTALSFSTPIIELLGVTSFFLFLIYTHLFTSTSNNDVLVLFALFAYSSMKILPYLINMVKSSQTLKFNYPATNLIVNILKKKNREITDKKKISDLDSITLKNVNFKYPKSRHKNLENVNINIKKGDVIGLTGKTGSGKTTLINIILGLLKVRSGKILINGSKKLRIMDIRDKIAFISQQIYLIDDQLKYNISLEYSLNKEKNKKINYLLKVLKLKNLKINYLVGERGAKLSGGQIQRIGIARALFREPSLLILDEATNSLDEKTENAILDYLLKEFKTKILVICTHKVELLKKCNKIFEIKNQKVIRKLS